MTVDSKIQKKIEVQKIEIHKCYFSIINAFYIANTIDKVKNIKGNDFKRQRDIFSNRFHQRPILSWLRISKKIKMLRIRCNCYISIKFH